jgi:3-hydroxyacyl-CoA dehydrogenase
VQIDEVAQHTPWGEGWAADWGRGLEKQLAEQEAIIKKYDAAGWLGRKSGRGFYTYAS